MEGDVHFFRNSLYSVFIFSTTKAGQLSSSWLSSETLFQGNFGFWVNKRVELRHFIM